jgi:hypothetical protein
MSLVKHGSAGRSRQTFSVAVVNLRLLWVVPAHLKSPCRLSRAIQPLSVNHIPEGGVASSSSVEFSKSVRDYWRAFSR